MKRLIHLSMAVLMALAAISCNKDQPAEDEGNKEPAVVELSGITLSEHTLSLKKGESTRLEVTFTPANATDKTVTWESSDPSVATVQNGEVKGLAAGTAEITAKAGKVSDKCQVEVSLPVPEGAVDLGIVITRTDGTTYRLFWAESNLDAKGLCANPEEFGDYFAWGEKEPYYAEGNAEISPCTNWRLGKTGYNWASYKWCNGAKDKLTKYCPADKADYWGGDTPDGKTELKDYAYEDDAARYILKGNWRIPTVDEWMALVEQCPSEWTTDYKGLKLRGRVFTSTNGNSIFIPAAGHRENDYRYNPNMACEYWTACISAKNPSMATGFYLYSGEPFTEDDYRCNGRTIRPVCEE